MQNKAIDPPDPELDILCEVYWFILSWPKPGKTIKAEITEDFEEARDADADATGEDIQHRNDNSSN